MWFLLCFWVCGFCCVVMDVPTGQTFSDMLPLSVASMLVDATGKITKPGAFGTGFFVTNRVVLTCFHVLNVCISFSFSFFFFFLFFSFSFFFCSFPFSFSFSLSFFLLFFSFSFFFFLIFFVNIDIVSSLFSFSSSHTLSSFFLVKKIGARRCQEKHHHTQVERKR